jgi:hypothetical protein
MECDAERANKRFQLKADSASVEERRIGRSGSGKTLAAQAKTFPYILGDAQSKACLHFVRH